MTLVKGSRFLMALVKGSRFLLLLLVLNASAVSPTAFAGGCYPAIFSFGDSLTDTGNCLRSSGSNVSIGALPYGETFFHRATGRFTDGRIILDFIASAHGLPFVRPYLAGGAPEDFRHGANFAVGGATALDAEFYRNMGLFVFWTEYSLDAQINWFKDLVAGLNSSEANNSDTFLSESLFVVGEIGGNDYLHALCQNVTRTRVLTLVPLVITKIMSATNTILAHGARKLVVPGMTPIGCAPMLLDLFGDNQTAHDYDPATGCINWLNDLAEHHNTLLQDELDVLRRWHPHANIAYVDYFTDAMAIYRSPKQYGFEVTLSACCGAAGNASPLGQSCNGIAELCRDPSSYVSWDGVHYTEAAYRIMADGLMKGPFAVPALNPTCSQQDIAAY